MRIVLIICFLLNVLFVSAKDKLTKEGFIVTYIVVNNEKNTSEIYYSLVNEQNLFVDSLWRTVSVGQGFCVVDLPLSDTTQVYALDSAGVPLVRGFGPLELIKNLEGYGEYSSYNVQNPDKISSILGSTILCDSLYPQGIHLAVEKVKYSGFITSVPSFEDFALPQLNYYAHDGDSTISICGSSKFTLRRKVSEITAPYYFLVFLNVEPMGKGYRKLFGLRNKIVQLFTT